MCKMREFKMLGLRSKLFLLSRWLCGFLSSKNLSSELSLPWSIISPWNSFKLIFLDCSMNCAKCQSGKCLTCQENYLLSEGGCVSSCPAKTYSDGFSCQSKQSECLHFNQKSFVDCPTGCNICDGDTKCSTCDSNYLFYQGSCLSSCPAKTYSDGSTCQSKQFQHSNWN